MSRGVRKWLVRIPLFLIAASILVVLLLRWVPVRFTPLMLKRACQFREDTSYHREQHWVPLEDMSPDLIKAVLLCEDIKFYGHHGFDWPAIRWTWRHRHERQLTGCSTISQQTAKNVFTFGSRTVFRKALEAWWTVLIEWIWGKQRILEVYLNVAEMGRGIYGIGAATEHYYFVPPSDISESQAVALALSLPRPLVSDPLAVSDRVRMKYILGELKLVQFSPK